MRHILWHANQKIVPESMPNKAPHAISRGKCTPRYMRVKLESAAQKKSSMPVGVWRNTSVKNMAAPNVLAAWLEKNPYMPPR